MRSTTTRWPRWIAGTSTRDRDAERHRSELDQTSARAARAEGELAARSQELGELSRRVLRIEGVLDTARADLRDREVKWAQARDRTAELETKLADFEDQILRAYQKLRNDDKIVDQGQASPGCGLTLLDDRGWAAPAVAARHALRKRDSEAVASLSGFSSIATYCREHRGERGEHRAAVWPQPKGVR